MKKKEKLIIVILFSLSLSAILTNVLGQTTYTCKVKVGDDFIFTVTTLDEVFGEGLGLSVGDKMKINITDITEETDNFKVEYDTWDMISKGESFGSTADESDWEYVYKDPTDIYAYIYYFVLTPVSDYLAAFAETSESEYSSSGNKLIESYDSYQTIYTYDSNGVMSKMEYKMGGTVMAVLSRGGGGSSIPGYDLPILIGLTAIAGVSIIYIVKKKMLK